MLRIFRGPRGEGACPQRRQSGHPRPPRSEAIRRADDRGAREPHLRVGAGARADRAVPPDERRGRVRQVVSRRVRHRRCDRPQPSCLDALRVGDPRRARAAHDPDHRSAPVQRRRAGRMAAQVGRLRPRRRALRRPRPRWLQDGPRTSQGESGMTSRIERLRELLEEPLLVTNLVNVLYLTGFDSSNTALLVEPDRARLFTDFRYIESARAIDEVEAVQTKRAVIGWLCENLSGRIGFEADVLPWSYAEQLRDAGVELVPRKGLVEQLRAVKDEGELETFRRACAITDRMFERLVSEVPFVGRRERDVAWDITRLYHEEGADEPAFEAIVGSGPTGARPHGRAGDRVIEAGELVVIDTGANVAGYVADYTRTLATGELDGEMREAYDVVRAAQQAGLDAIRPGVRGVDADAAARGVIEGSDFAGTFGHGLGHGLGLDVHETQRLSTESSDTLAPGNVVTVEPGVYLEGRFGIRIEDDVVVTDDGIENPVQFTKELLTVG